MEHLDNTGLIYTCPCGTALDTKDMRLSEAHTLVSEWLTKHDDHDTCCVLPGASFLFEIHRRATTPITPM